MATQAELQKAREALRQFRQTQATAPSGSDSSDSMEEARKALQQFRQGQVQTAPVPRETTPQTPPEATQAPERSFGENLLLGGLKGIGSTLAGAQSLGEKGLSAITRGLGITPLTETVGQGKTVGESVKESGVVTPKGTAQKIGFGAEQIGEFLLPGAASTKLAGLAEKSLINAPKVVRGLGRLGARSAAEAGIFGGQTALQTGGDIDEVKKAGITGAIVPVAGKVIGATGRTALKPLQPERLMSKALGFTKTQIKNLNKKIQSSGTYKSVADFAIKNGFQGSRQEMADQIGNRFSELMQTKPEILSRITTPIKNTFKEAFNYLKKTYKTPGQEAALKEIETLANKKTLTAAELDRIRYLIDRSLPSGAYRGAEPVRVEGIQNLVDPMRRTLEKLDKTGTIKSTNQDIRILYDMMKAMEHSKSGNVGAQALWRTMQRVVGAGGATALGLPPAITAPFVLAELATDFPQVSSFLAQRFAGVSAKIPEKLPVSVKIILERFFGK